MAGSAEVHGVCRFQFGGIEDQIGNGIALQYLSFRQRQLLSDRVLPPGPVTGFTGNARYDLAPIKLAADGRGSCMARKASDQFVAAYSTRHSLLNVQRFGELASRRELQSFESVEVRSAAFIKLSVPLEEIGLANVAIAKGPSQRSRQTLRAVCHRVSAYPFCGRDLIGNLTRLKCEAVARRQNVRVSHR